MSERAVRGSLAQVAQQRGQSLAEVLLGARFVAVVDTSGSMQSPDSRGGRRRIDVAREELAQLQAERPGEIALVCFESAARWVPGGVPPEPAGGTDLAGGLRFARQVDDPETRFVVISDGYPDDQAAALAEAKRFAGALSTVYVGPEGDREARRFLQALAQAGRGRAETAVRVTGLADAVRPLLAASGGRP